ncbi:hypothetical protein SERLA73DRAFT_190177 [Serpula lacrymans var. lacrymans S7.3]|uniref:AB hydrolase-1 domain-containing protein n=2 Tax=Serpula lacrymans var. lacrymans TaxID=341189 RepID=F8QF72_SERL3|nr:uncharacterized protein SERLADRAFT_462042 [Serpula lacrymans var. lacrymans S7.9]EGN93031.1 hypothetical protein SERLA73DRAFT_190177 [Serpula lacrymans var. lacrymans S7.3]EGO27869.1 hypothetical protein SERLADRAFT_462042 [Serpula lacrymans var. lacrymans S7.9]
MPSGSHGEEEQKQLVVAKTLPLDLILVIFIHGFKGTDTTFGDFPSRLEHVLTETVDHVRVECIPFPAYETKGELTEAVERFADWLTTLTVQKEVENGTGGGAGKAKIILCGHSMGGLLAADALLEFVNSRPDKQAPLWPKIIACIAFDTPYLGLHPFVFKNSATKAVEYASSARTVASDIFSLFGKKSTTPVAPQKLPAASITSSSMGTSSEAGWMKWAPAAYAVGGALIAGAAAGTAYYRRDDLGSGYTWATDHMKYVKNLWDEKTLQKRLDCLVEAEQNFGVLFRNFYTLIPPSFPSYTPARTFVVLPQQSSPSTSYFLPAKNSIASDEVQAHTGMFDAKSNDGYYALGLETAKIIREAVMISRGIVEDDSTQAAQDSVAAEAMEQTRQPGDVNVGIETAEPSEGS